MSNRVICKVHHNLWTRPSNSLFHPQGEWNLRSEQHWVPFNRSEVFVGEREFFGYLSSKDFFFLSLCILAYSLWIPISKPSTNNNQEFFSELVTQTKDTFFFFPLHLATQPLLFVWWKKGPFPPPPSLQQPFVLWPTSSQRWIPYPYKVATWVGVTWASSWSVSYHKSSHLFLTSSDLTSSKTPTQIRME
jgi:hypothetical protein